MKKKIYIQYCRPYKDDDDEPPILEIWSDGQRPKKKWADGVTLFVMDETDEKDKEGRMICDNERPWDGIE